MAKASFESIFPADVVAVQGKPYLFSNLRIERDTVPEGFYAYDVADECDGEFWKVQKFVMVNHWATIVGIEPIELDEGGQFWCEPDENNPDLSSEGQFIGYTMNDRADFVVWYGALKGYTKC